MTVPARPASRRPLSLRSLVSLGAATVLAAGAVGVAPTAQAAPASVVITAAAPAPAVKAAKKKKKRKVPSAVRIGMQNKRVKRLQKLLNVTPRSGYYGPRTQAAVRAFKRSHGLKGSAKFGKKAWRALLAAKGKAPKRGAGSRASRAARTGVRVCPAPNTRFSNDYQAPRVGHRHAGIDMMGRRGMPLYAVEDGYVVREGRQSNGALRIVIQGTQTGAKYYYGHNSKHLLRAGQHFRAGTVIALMGDTGSPGINHLHFEWWKSGGESDHVNPYQLLRDLC